MILTNLLLAAIFVALLHIGERLSKVVKIQFAYLITTAPPAVVDYFSGMNRESTCSWYHAGGGDADKPCRNYGGGRPPR